MSAVSADVGPVVTHEVFNQSIPRVDLDEFECNVPLREAVESHHGEWALEHLHEAGRVYGAADYKRWAVEANVNQPVLQRFDRYGNRIDEVEFHPAWHEVISRSVGLGTHAFAWREPRVGAHVTRAALMVMLSQVEPGHGCPIGMTYSVVPALRRQPELAAEWEPRLTSLDYDFGLRPGVEKRGVLAGMGMTEKQGGTDVRANTTRALALNGGGPGGEYVLRGHKWFTSAPMCDVFLVLAQVEAGLSCFLVPRVLPDGTRNAVRIERLKDKLGNQSNASAELELDGTWAQMVGEPGRGVPTIIEMVNHTRLECVLGTTGGMRDAVSEALWHAAHREVYGARLLDQELMTNVLADLCLESEAATWAAMRLARSFDEQISEREVLFKRLATPVLKYWICKRGPNHAFEALECLGGNGYCETFPLARRYREQPLLSIWEGSGNVMCLDVLRALQRSPQSLDAFLFEIELASGANPHLDAYIADLPRQLGDPQAGVRHARRMVERMALALQASLLVRHAPAVVADAFCASRLTPEHSYEYGTLAGPTNLRAIVARHAPHLD
ncbi:MAG: acyl-CoA dehydrogenase family protein [Streptosporangiaceae bacterium]